MRKSTKIAMLVAAIVLLASLTVFAKGWKQDDYGWYYEDSYGMMEYLKWEKSGDNYYYLGEDGYMATNALVQDSNGAKYWVGADGAKVVNAWVQVPADEYDQEQYGVDYRWYRFGATGKAVTTNVTLDGKKYFFDAEGKMLFGYHDGSQIVSLETPFNASKYYCGTNEDGAMVKDTWYRIDVTDQEAYDDVTYKWVYYKSNGQKAVGDDNKNGLVWKNNRYFFDAEGRMYASYQTLTINSTPSSLYLSGSDDGHMVKRAWVYSVPEDDSSDSDKHWYYYDAAGHAITGQQVKKINGKYYAFAAGTGDLTASRMLVKFVKLTGTEATDAVVTDATAAENVKPANFTVAEWMADPNLKQVYYFSGDEANDGSLKKAITVNNVEFFDDYANIVLDKAGKLANGLYNNRYYQNGILQAASVEDRYAVIEVTEKDGTTAYKLLSSSGVAVKSGIATDGDGNYYIVLAKDNTAWTAGIYRVGNYFDYAVRAAQCITSAKTEFTADGDTYKINLGTGAEGYTDVTYSLK